MVSTDKKIGKILFIFLWKKILEGSNMIFTLFILHITADTADDDTNKDVANNIE